MPHLCRIIWYTAMATPWVLSVLLGFFDTCPPFINESTLCSPHRQSCCLALMLPRPWSWPSSVLRARARSRKEWRRCDAKYVHAWTKTVHDSVSHERYNWDNHEIFLRDKNKRKQLLPCFDMNVSKLVEDSGGLRQMYRYIFILRERERDIH